MRERERERETHTQTDRAHISFTGHDYRGRISAENFRNKKKVVYSIYTNEKYKLYILYHQGLLQLFFSTKRT